jgi:CRP-like cAMP-binding protein
MAVGKLVIREAEIFRGLDKETINYLAAGADAETYQQGDWIYQFEETGQALEIVHLGAVEAFLRPAAGEELAWGIVGPHECLPNSAVLPFTPWPSGARAIAPTTLIAVSARRLQAIMTFNTKAADRISRNAQKLTLEWRARLSKLAPESVTSFVSEIACPYGVRTTHARLQLQGDEQGATVEGTCEAQPFCLVEACPIARRPAHQFARFWSQQGFGNVDR